MLACGLTHDHSHTFPRCERSRFNRETGAVVIQRAVRRKQAKLGSMDLGTLVKALQVHARVQSHLASVAPTDRDFLQQTLYQVGAGAPHATAVVDALSYSPLCRCTQALYYHCVLVDFDAARRTYGSLPKKVRIMPVWRRRGRGWVGPHLRCRLLVGMWASIAASGGAMGVGVVCAG